MSAAGPRELFSRFEPPPAREALRLRVIAAARVGLASSRRPSRSDRIWFSRGWRIAWVAALACCALIEVFAARAGSGAAEERRPIAGPALRESDAAAAALGLPKRGWVGACVVTGDESAHRAAEEAT
jgi:hypothetical protein